MKRLKIVLSNVKIKFQSFSRLEAINLNREFPAFFPSSAGNYKKRSQTTVSTINNVFPFLDLLGREGLNLSSSPVIDINEFMPHLENELEKKKLKILFDEYGSDKSDIHDYENLYVKILGDGSQIKGILEIGLGTNNSDVISNMGLSGKPGASLRAFRDFCPNANIYGADIDKRILFSEHRINTFYVDQTSLVTLEQLLSQLPKNLDLVIDDGLHSPDANIATLNFALKVIRPGGWIVIEDINQNTLVLWQFVSQIFPSNFKTYLIRTAKSYVFAVQKNCI